MTIVVMERYEAYAISCRSASSASKRMPSTGESSSSQSEAKVIKLPDSSARA